MQVSCGQCGMRYEFDAAEIPAEGYDAQCSNCSSVFFVAPEAPVAEAADFSHAPHDSGATQDDAHIVPQLSVQVAISCPQCSALYQFDSLDVPEAGYDAQCTQCEAIFLVAPHTVAPYEAAPAEPAPLGVDDETSFASVNELLGQAENPPAEPELMNTAEPDQTHVGALPRDDFDRTHVGAAPREAFDRTHVGAVTQDEPANPHMEPTRPGFSPQLLDGGTFDRTDPNLRVPEGYGAAAPRNTVLVAPFSEAASVDAAAQSGSHEHTHTHVKAAPQREVAHASAQPPTPPSDESRSTVLSTLPADAGASYEPPSYEPPSYEPAPPSHTPEASARAQEDAQPNPWTTAAEQAERMEAPPTNPAMMVPRPGAPTDERLPTGVLPPDASGESQRLRTAPMEDVAAARRKRRSSPDTGAPPGRALRIVLMVLLVLLGGLWFVAEKRPEMLGQMLQTHPQSHAVASEAVTLFEQGKKALLRDTDADYEVAIETFGKALQQDAQYADALAWQVVAHSLRGADLRREGARMYADWEQEQALWRGLKALERQGATLSQEQSAQSQQLEEQGPKHLQAATETLERGGKELSVAQVQAQRARSLFPRSSPIAAAAALCYTQTPSDMAVAQSLLGQYSGLAAPEGEAAGSKAAAPPSDIWLLLAQGRVAATQEKTRDEARAAFTKALEIEPNLIRARWELAQLDVDAGKPDDAKKRYQEILSAVQNHPKSLAALAALEHPAPAASASPAVSPSPDAKEGTPATNLDAAAPAAAGDSPEGDAPQAPKRLRHRRRPPPVAPASPDTPGAAEPAPAPVPPENE